MPPRLVEFVGLPGAGKTTVLRHMKSAVLDVADVAIMSMGQLVASECEGPRRRWLAALRHMMACPDSLLSSSSVFLVGRDSGAERFRRLYAWHLLSARIGSPLLDTSVLIVDQGPVQLLASAVYKRDKAPHRSLRRLLGALRKASTEYTVVEFLVPPIVAASRISERSDGDSRFDQLQGSLLTRELEHYRQGLQVVLDGARAERLSVHSVSALESPSDCASRLAYGLRERVACWPCATA